MALWELNTPSMGVNTTCNYCLKITSNWYDSEDTGKAICVSCLHKGKRANNEMLCECCNLQLEVNDSVKLCHYCYLRECGLNPGKCDNALTLNKEKEGRK